MTERVNPRTGMFVVLEASALSQEAKVQLREARFKRSMGAVRLLEGIVLNSGEPELVLTAQLCKLLYETMAIAPTGSDWHHVWMKTCKWELALEEMAPNV